jgi:hypothetical protein
VPLGVVFALSTRDFRDPDRGVILLLRKVDTGVERSSLDPLSVVSFSERGPLRANGVETVGGAVPATLGVNGVLLDVFAEALRTGIRGLEGFCFS